MRNRIERFMHIENNSDRVIVAGTVLGFIAYVTFVFMYY